MTAPGEGTTPDAPDVDQPEGGQHGGDEATSRTPNAPDVDQPEGGDHGGPSEQ